jgi:hypothetical protein
MTHVEPPWAVAREGLADDAVSRRVISNDATMAYYSSAGGDGDLGDRIEESVRQARLLYRLPGIIERHRSCFEQLG